MTTTYRELNDPINEVAPLLPGLVSQINHEYKHQGDCDEDAIKETPYCVKVEKLV